MTAAELIETLRVDFLDDTVEPYRWDDELLLRWLNLAQEQVCRRQRVLVDESTPGVTQVPIVVDQATYQLDPSIVLVESVTLDGVPLTKSTPAQLDAKYAGWRDQPHDTPLHYMQTGLTLTLFPTPSTEGESLALRVWRMPLAKMTESSEPEIDPIYHENLCLYAAHRAFRMPDEDLRDSGLAAQYLAEFDAIFGPPMSYDVLEHRRRHEAVSDVRPSHAYHGRRTQSLRRDPFDYE